MMKHASVGNALTQAEWEAEDIHLIDGLPAGQVLMTSIPPSGMCRVLNIYYDPQQGKAIVEYDDEPVS